MKILITGLPATGKTGIGIYLEGEGYTHFDVEDPAHSNDAFSKLQKFVADPEDKKVITWGFWPGVDDQTVRMIQSKDFRLFWFEGPRAVVRRHYALRGTGTLNLLESQLARIDTMNLEDFAPVIRVNPYAPNGEFLTREDIAARLLNAGSPNNF